MRNGFHASSAWLQTLQQIFTDGIDVAPRGLKTLELQHHAVHLDMSHPVVLCPARKLSYTFLAAEALWILSGDDRVETIAPYNKNIAQFSDDGHRFYGAYGPRIMEQFDWVVEKLLEDRDTRQAVMTIWRKKPPKTKDVPCTVAIMFSNRKGRLHCHVFMRSSDAWLGLPYDVFNFSMLSAKVACSFNRKCRPEDTIELGFLHLTAASSHLYERNFAEARECLEDGRAPAGDHVPVDWTLNGDWDAIWESLMSCRDKSVNPGWRIRP